MINQIVCDGLQPAFGHRYQIQKKLSDKAGRQTYLAHDQQQDQQVVLKLLNFDDAITWDHFKLFEREAKTLQNLSHPAIPQYRDYLDLDSGESKGFALVQTYIKAESLETYLQSGRTFSEEEIKQLAESLLEILTYLHNHHPPVIHRDIKPSNILLGDRSGNHLGQVYLVDFGSVQTVANKESGTITIVGSYGYIPFEQFCGQAAPASDLYSLGMTLLYLATGVHPAEQPQKQGEVQVQNTGLSRSLEQWLKKMTCPSLNRRFSDSQSALEALLDGQSDNISTLKPERTSVQLQRTYDRFEVIIPRYFKFEKVFFWLTALMGGIVLCFVAPEVFLGIGLLIIWMILCILPWGVILFGLWWLFTPADKRLTTSPAIRQFRQIKKMVIDDHTITLQTYFDKDRRPRSRINRLCYACSYEFDHFWDSSGTKRNRGKVKVEPKLIINVEGFDYTIEGLADAEYWWLGQELSDFLGLELQLIYSTPKVPPEPSCGGGC